MAFLTLDQLPFVGMSYEFVGETQNAPFSAYMVNAKPGQGPPLHTHPYVEVAFTLEGRATITVGTETREVSTGAVVVIPANYAAPFRELGGRGPASDRHPRQSAICSDKSHLNIHAGSKLGVGYNSFLNFQFPGSYFP